MRPYDSVKNNQPGRSLFNCSYTKKLTCDMGQLIPVMCDVLMPGGKFIIGNEAVVRMQPLVAPVLHEINLYVHYFFVPYRLLWEDWEDFITGGETGTDTSTQPYWDPTDTAAGSLWDYFGFPVGVDPTGFRPVDFPKRAYNMIWNEYYRDENLQTAIDITTSEVILLRNWHKDRFTSALLQQQKGTAPSLPISGITSAVWDASAFGSTTADFALDLQSSGNKFYSTAGGGVTTAQAAFNNNTVDLSVASTFDIADLRYAIQTQRWLEMANRAGSRYTEHLKGHHGIKPQDERLQRPEYIGGSKSPIIISEVLQTSETATTPQGNLAGHGLSVSQQFCGKYYAKEDGLVMGIMSIMPIPTYSGQGVDKQWRQDTRYDYFFPEFINLSEEPILRGELYANTTSGDNNTLFGYQGRYDEYRVKHNMVVAGMRSTYDYWHLSRQFGSAPLLNESFIQCIPRKDIFAAPSEPGFIVNFANLIKAILPLPIQATPGLIDHVR